MNTASKLPGSAASPARTEPSWPWLYASLCTSVTEKSRTCRSTAARAKPVTTTTSSTPAPLKATSCRRISGTPCSRISGLATPPMRRPSPAASSTAPIRNLGYNPPPGLSKHPMIVIPLSQYAEFIGIGTPRIPAHSVRLIFSSDYTPASTAQKTDLDSWNDQLSAGAETYIGNFSGIVIDRQVFLCTTQG